MVTKISKSEFRKLIDECNFRSRVDNDGDFVIVLDADQDFNHDLFIWFIVNEENGKLYALAEASDFEIEESNLAHALIKCNEWNNNNMFQAYVFKNRYRISYSIFNDEPVSESYIKENFIKLCPSGFWKFFCSLTK